MLIFNQVIIMEKKYIYLDYSATTKPDKKVIKYFCDISENNYANPNSNHILGKKAHKVIDKTTKIICNYLNINEDELIYTSGASESNNTVFKGLIKDNRKHIITSPLPLFIFRTKESGSFSHSISSGLSQWPYSFTRLAS